MPTAVEQWTLRSRYRGRSEKRLTNEHAKLLVALSTTISIVADLTVSKLSRKVSSLYLV